MIALWAILKMLARLVYGVRLSFMPRRGSVSLGGAEILIPLLLGMRFILSNFDYLQVNILILALTVGGLYRHSRGSDISGGVLIGLAGALKVMPVLFVPYLFLRRRLRAGLAALASLAFFTLVPGFVFGVNRLIGYLKDWPRAAGLGWGVDWQNQSLYAMVDRYVGFRVTPFNASRLARELDASSGEPAVLVVTAILMGVFVFAALLSSRGPAAPRSRAAVAEYGMVFIMSCVFCPLTWKSYFVALICPLFLLAGLVIRASLPVFEGKVAAAALVAYLLLVSLTASGIVGKNVAAVLQTLSVPTIGALIVLAVLIMVRPALSGRARTWAP